MIDNTLNSFLAIILSSALAGIFLAFYLAKKVLAKESGDEKMQEVSGAILSGANAYLKRQFTTITPILVILTVFLYFTADEPFLGVGGAVAFFVWAFFLALVR